MIMSAFDIGKAFCYRLTTIILRESQSNVSYNFCCKVLGHMDNQVFAYTN